MNVYDVLRRDEGLRLKPYLCTAGKTTIGYGRNLDDAGISQEEAEVMLRNDVQRCVLEAMQYGWYEGLNEARKAVVVSMIFQLGSKGFAKFKNTHSDIAKGDYWSAHNRMLQSLWAEQTPQRAKRLANSMKNGVLE